MIRPTNIADLADFLVPDWCHYKGLALLRAYFDESGIHAGSPVTLVSGFIGSRRQWRTVSREWDALMGDRVFHYKNMRMEGELLGKLAALLATSNLGVVAAGFSGNWNRAISAGPDWSVRFPSCYHMILEMCVEQMNRYSQRHWHSEPIAVMFSRQNEYAKRAEEVWRTCKGNGLWDNIASFAYGDPEKFPALQAADMIAYESFQCTKAGGTLEVWNNWPLVKLLLAKNEPMMVGGLHTEESFIEMMRKGDLNRRYLKTVPKKA